MIIRVDFLKHFSQTNLKKTKCYPQRICPKHINLCWGNIMCESEYYLKYLHLKMKYNYRA